MLTAEQIDQLRASRLTGRNRVAKARELARETQAELAGALGLTQPHISSIENDGYIDLPLETTRAFADHYGVLIEDLFFPASSEAVAS